MQVSHIVPIRYMDLAAKNSSFLLAEASLLHRRESYMKMMKETGLPLVMLVGTSDFLTNGTQVFSAAVKLAEKAGVETVICPSMPDKKDETLQILKEMLKATKDSELKVMAVPQGANCMDYEACLSEMLVLEGIASYGFPAPLLNRIGGEFTGQDSVYQNRNFMLRRRIMKLIMRMGTWTCCLLELGQGGGLELAEAVGRFERLDRCITAAAFGSAIKGRDLSKEGNDFPVPDLDFNCDFQAENEEDLIPLAYRNIRFLNEQGRSIGM